MIVPGRVGAQAAADNARENGRHQRVQVGRHVGVRRAQQRVGEAERGGETRQVPQVALDLSASE